MKILTLNINSIRAHIDTVINILKSNLYDVILLQELKVETNLFPYYIFENYPYNIKVYGQKSWNGVAIFSKYSIEDTYLGISDYDNMNARFMECVIDGKIRIINVYMPNGDTINSDKYYYKIEWMNKFTDYIKRLLNSDELVIIGGDFNIALEDRDVWNPKLYKDISIASPEARRIMNSWLTDGWIDVWRFFHSSDIDYTWYGYRNKNSILKKQGLRLDYFLANKKSINFINSCEIDMNPRLETKPTDHTGLILDIF